MVISMIKKYLAKFILNYFRYFARIQLKKNSKAVIIGITGSSGKTSTRLAVSHILKQRGRVKTSSHANSQSGISLNILGLTPKTYSFFDWLRLIILAPIRAWKLDEKFDYYVVEMGVDGPDSPNNMAYLLSILKPHIGVVLNVGLSHAQNFDYLVKDQNPTRRQQKILHLIAKEKMQLVKSLPLTGVAIYNIDSKELKMASHDIEARHFTFGKSKSAKLQIAGNNKFIYQGTTYALALPDVFPPSYAHTFAAAISVACSLGISPRISVAALSTFRSPAGRMRILSGINNSILLDSSYNASPHAMQDSLILLKKVAGTKKKIAVIGDMNELGTTTKILHKELAISLLEYSDEVLLYGKLTKLYVLPYLQSHNHKVFHFDRMQDLIAHLQKNLKQNTHVLFKGSQNGIFLERAVAACLSDKKDIKLLCRRGPFWDQLRRVSP